jgi:gluconokinase
MIWIVMGVCGCGKSSIGAMLAERLGVAFYDADVFHPEANVKKMAAGTPLDDDDRWPWLDRMAAEMPGWEAAGGAVLACSALKEIYRERLRAGGDARFIYLRGGRELILERMRARQGHYMPPALLDSQLATLEEPADAIIVDIDESPEAIVDAILGAIRAGASN